jgi:hypothetical protein
MIRCAKWLNVAPIPKSIITDYYSISEHNMHHRIILPSENGRKPKIQARPRSNIIT